MVHVPTRGGVPVRLGPGVPITPGYGAEHHEPPALHRSDAVRAGAGEGAGRDVAAGRPVVAGRRARRLDQLREPRRDRGHHPPARRRRWPRSTTSAATAAPSFVTEWQGCGARKFTCPYHGWMYDTTGKVIGVPEKVDFDAGAAARPAGAGRRRRRVGRLGLGQPRRSRRRAVAAGVDRRGHHARPRPVPDGGHGPARGARVGRAGQLQGDRRRLQRDLPHGRAAPRRPGVDEVGQGHHLPRRQRPQLHVLRPAAAVPRRSWPRTGTTSGTRSATTSCSRTRSSTATPSTSRCSTRSRSTSTAPASSAGSSSTRATTTIPSTPTTRSACCGTGST